MKNLPKWVEKAVTRVETAGANGLNNDSYKIAFTQGRGYELRVILASTAEEAEKKLYRMAGQEATGGRAALFSPDCQLINYIYREAI